MTSNPETSNLIFPEDTPAENVVKAVLDMLQTHHEHQLSGLRVLLTDFPNAYAEQFIETWTLMKASSTDEVVALSHLRQIISKRLEETSHPEALLVNPMPPRFIANEDQRRL